MQASALGDGLMDDVGLGMADLFTEVPDDLQRRLSWVVINVRDADRSLEFYERFTTLRATGRLECHDAPAFGFERGSFVGYEMRDPYSSKLASVLLVQWKYPQPEGETYGSHANPGFFRMCFQCLDAAELYDKVCAAGFEPLSPLRLPKPGRSAGRPVFCVKDPDGAVLQFITFAGHPRLYHLNCNTNDIARADQFFGRVIGLNCTTKSSSSTPEEHAFGPGGDFHTYDARFYAGIGAESEEPALLLDVVESTFPPPIGSAYRSATNVGIARLSIEVSDVEAALNTARAMDPSSILHSSDVWTLGPALGRRLGATLRSPDGARIDLISPALVD